MMEAAAARALVEESRGSCIMVVAASRGGNSRQRWEGSGLQW